MPDITPFPAIFFDLGGTLFYHLPKSFTADNVLECMRLISATLPAKDAEILQQYNQYRRQLDQEYLHSTFFMHRQLVAEAFRRTLAAFALPAPIEVVTAFCDRQAEHVTQHLQLRPDTIETLTALQNRGVYIAIVSNIDDNYIVPLLAHTQLAAHLDWWISSQRARSCKPHAGIFQQALAAAQVPSHQVLFVGDSYLHDVIGAKRLGMSTALLTIDHKEEAPPGADYTIKHLSELLNLED